MVGSEFTCTTIKMVTTKGYKETTYMYTNRVFVRGKVHGDGHSLYTVLRDVH